MPALQYYAYVMEELLLCTTEYIPLLWLLDWAHEQGGEDFWASRKQPQEEEEVVASKC